MTRALRRRDANTGVSAAHAFGLVVADAGDDQMISTAILSPKRTPCTFRQPLTATRGAASGATDKETTPACPSTLGSRRVEAPQGRAAVSMVTSHQQPNPRVGRPSRESNPVHGLSQGPADIQSQGAIEERSLNTANPLVFCSQSGTGNIVRRGLRAPSARQGPCLIFLAPEMAKCPLSPVIQVIHLLG